MACLPFDRSLLRSLRSSTCLFACDGDPCKPLMWTGGDIFMSIDTKVQICTWTRGWPTSSMLPRIKVQGEVPTSILSRYSVKLSIEDGAPRKQYMEWQGTGYWIILPNMGPVS